MSVQKFENSFEYKLIYIFSVNDERHKGLLKIGETTISSDKKYTELRENCKELNKAAKKRIDSYAVTMGMRYDLLHTEVAVKKTLNNGVRSFTDHEVHQVLFNSNIKKYKFKGSKAREWFKIDLETAKNAINAVKNNKKNLRGEEIKNIYGFDKIKFRPEQEEAIKLTVNRYKKKTNNDVMLWNAKMRFGKTLSALEVIKRMGFKRSIIITHRPVVNEGWYEDFKKIFPKEENFIYGSKTYANNIGECIDSNKNFVYFASMQDLRGSEVVGGKHSKNDEIFNTEWDFVIVDEAHEGTKTVLGDNVINSLLQSKGSEEKTKFLALSGTPFNIIEEYDEDNVYTWDYVNEQESKMNWDKEHCGDPNPYEDLPQLKIYTYDLGKLVNNSYINIEDKAFNFREFFRTWTGVKKIDGSNIPNEELKGKFVHENDVRSFLNLITKEDEESKYPFSTEKSRNIFKHTLWMLPGVKEAKAFADLLKEHPIFGSEDFEIVNVAGTEEEGDHALDNVKRAIANAGEHKYTITLSCGKLTTGVTVKEWTAVFMLSGSYSTSATSYLQTIFRVQSPCKKFGKVKTTGYVFDFAPDRTLSMIAQAVSVTNKKNTRGGQDDDEEKIGKFLNYCPVISIEGTNMREINTRRMLGTLKKVYAQRAFLSGFSDDSIYNDELLLLDDMDMSNFKKLQGIIGKSKQEVDTSKIKINEQGLDQEEYEQAKKDKKKKKLTKEEEERRKKLEKLKKQKKDAISILRGISIRIPLLIYGAEVEITEDITLDRFQEIVDDVSWEEFMPKGVTKKLFGQFKKYYDEDVFILAGKKIREKAKRADQLEPTERVKQIAELFSYFKNPDKETVLTPWRVVNMHMNTCLGGYNFFDENFEKTLEVPKFKNRGKVTEDLFLNEDVKILEMNSKTGLYPLYLAYSVYRNKCKGKVDLTLEEKNQIWSEVVNDNIFVATRTKMAKSITKRTLNGYKEIKANVHTIQNLIYKLEKESDRLVGKFRRGKTWDKKGKDMKFDAIVGNPPYQESDGGAGASAKPIYNLFTEGAKKINPTYLSFIMPSRWFAGGKGLLKFRESMLNDNHISKIVDYVNAKDCFPNVSIGGGVSYFLRDINYIGECEFTSIFADKKDTSMRILNEFPVFIRHNTALRIIHKINAKSEKKLDSIISTRNPFGIPSSRRGANNKKSEQDVLLITSAGKFYINKDEVKKDELKDKYKVLFSKATAEHAGEPDKSGKMKVLSRTEVICKNTVCTDSYLIAGAYNTELEAINLYKYMCTKFVRYLLLQAVTSINLSKEKFMFIPIQDFSNQSELDWNKTTDEIDEQLFNKYNLTEEEIENIKKIIKEMK